MPAQSAEVAFYVIASGLENLRNQEPAAKIDVQLAYVKSKLFDDNLVFRKDRGDILRKLNNNFRQDWSMSRIKSADLANLSGVEIKEPEVVQGSVEVEVPAEQLNTFKQAGAEGGVVVDIVSPEAVQNDILINDTPTFRRQTGNEKVYSEIKRALDAGGTFSINPVVYYPTLGFMENGYFVLGVAENKDTSIDWVILLMDENMHVVETASNLDEWVVTEFTDINLHVTAMTISKPEIQLRIAKLMSTVFPDLYTEFLDYFVRVDNSAYQQLMDHFNQPTKNATKNQNSNIAIEESNMQTNIPQELQASFNVFMKALEKMEEEERFAAYLDFVNNNAEVGELYQEFIKDKGMEEGSVKDDVFFLFLSTDASIHEAFMESIVEEEGEAKAPVKKSKSRFSLTGDDNKGPRGSWIAAASAVVGGGMEMFARDGVTVGAAVGTVGAAVGAYFLGEQVDKHIDHQYGRYVAAGMIGMAAGGIGAAVGRNLITGVQLPDFVNFGNSEKQEQVEVVALPQS